MNDTMELQRDIAPLAPNDPQGDLPISAGGAGQMTPMGMIQIAVQKGANVDQLQKLFELQLAWEKNEARKAYQVAFANFKAEAVAVIRRTGISDGPLKGKMYADLSTAVDAATLALSKHGLSSSWKIVKNEKDWIDVSCTLTHSAGHSESATFGGPPDTGGAKSAIQARASTLTYLERYTFLAVTGLAARGSDTDGKPVVRGLSEKQMADFKAAIDALVDKPSWSDLWKKITEATTAAGDVTGHDELKSLMAAKFKALA